MAELSILAQLVAEWPKPPWSWDGRFLMVSCAITGADIETARTLAVRVLPHTFDSTSLDSAPSSLRALLQKCGGLRGNQLAFCDDATTPTVVGLWWPWGGNATVSLRIGLFDTSDSATSSLREFFSAA